MAMATERTTTPEVRPLAPSRRALFGAGAALLAGGALSDPAFVKPLPWRYGPRPPDGADAELIRLCAEITRLEAWIAAYEQIPAEPSEEVADRFEETHDQWWAAMERVEELPATTLAGLQAKATALRIAIDRTAIPDIHSTIKDAEFHERFADSLCANILVIGGVA